MENTDDILKIWNDSEFKKTLSDSEYRYLINIVDTELSRESSIVLNKLTELPSYFYSNIFSAYYPLTEDLIYRNNQKINWSYLSENISLNWSQELIEIFKEYWNWRMLSFNIAIPWTEELIEIYADKWDWEALSRNPSFYKKTFPWSELFNNKYFEKINYIELSSLDISFSHDFIIRHQSKLNFYSLSRNEKIEFTPNLLFHFADKWDWTFLKNKLDYDFGNYEELILKNFEFWDWKKFSGKTDFPWTLILIEKFAYKVDWDKISSNPIINWNAEFLHKHQFKLSWISLSRNIGLPWNDDLINEFKDKWDWCGLCQNTSIRWDKNLIEQFEKYIDLHALSLNKNVLWSVEIIDKYTSNWCEGAEQYLNLCLDLEPISEYFNNREQMEIFVEKYKEKLNWTRLSKNSHIKLSESFISKHSDRWDWNSISAKLDELFPWSENFLTQCSRKFNWSLITQSNNQLPWSFELIEKYKNDWVWYNISRYFEWNKFNSDQSAILKEETIERYINYWDWEQLSMHGYIDFNIDLLIRYKDRWNYRELAFNSCLYEDVIKKISISKVDYLLSKGYKYPPENDQEFLF